MLATYEKVFKDMRITVVTTFHQPGLEQYGQRFIDSFSKNVDPRIRMVVYAEKCKLPMHTDKPNYEWSATICMSYEAPECWPIYIGEDAVYLEPGDCLLNLGAKEEHGRPVFKGSWQTFWLHQYGTRILGISQNIHGKPNHFKELNLKKKI